MNEVDYEVVKEWTLPVLKDNIKEYGKLWTTLAATEYISDSMRIESFNWKYDVIIIGMSDDTTLVLSENTILGVADSYKFR